MRSIMLVVQTVVLGLVVISGVARTGAAAERLQEISAASSPADALESTWPLVAVAGGCLIVSRARLPRDK